MKVTISEGCDRCKREVPKQIDSSEVAALEQVAVTREQACANIVKYLKDQTDGPDLLVSFKGVIKTVDRVCDAFCKNTVQNNLDAIFKQIDSTKRKPRTRKEKPDGDNSEEKKGKSKKDGKSAVEEKHSPQVASK